MELNDGASGVYPAQWIRKVISEGYVRSSLPLPDPDATQIQPASLDLRIGERAYPLRASFLPGAETVEDKLETYALGVPLDLRDGAVLERNRPYLIPLAEELELPPGLRARANPKSSIGRLDVFTRVITDRSHRFDEVAPGYAGRLWLEVFSRTFTIFVRSGQMLNQLRLVSGRPMLSDEEILETHRDEPLVVGDGGAVPEGRLSLRDGLFLSLDLRGDSEGFIGYRARKNSRLLDLTGASHDPDDFWEPVHSERGDRLVLEPEEFYLLISREEVRIPPGLAAEMNAYDPTAGELRTHYAGFFDPGFGYLGPGELTGSRAVLEVRAHDVPFVVEHGQQVCRLAFERMLEPPEAVYGESIGSSYQGQVAVLSRFFRRGRA